jgi:hypothetical protein
MLNWLFDPTITFMISNWLLATHQATPLQPSWSQLDSPATSGPYLCYPGPSCLILINPSLLPLLGSSGCFLCALNYLSLHACTTLTPHSILLVAWAFASTAFDFHASRCGQQSIPNSVLTCCLCPLANHLWIPHRANSLIFCPPA